MRIQKRYWFGLAALAFFGLIAALSLPFAEPEPIVQGQPLNYWLDQYWLCNFQGHNSEESSKKIEGMLSAMDDGCVRALIGDLKSKHWSLATRLNNLAERWFRVGHMFGDSRDRRAMAALVLGRLGTRATNAIPALDAIRHVETGGESEYWISPGGAALTALVFIRHDSVEACATNALVVSNSYRACYRDAIICLETNAATSVPIFVKAIEAPADDESKEYAALALGTIHSRPGLSLPVLTSMLTETNPSSRKIAAHALSLFGSAAKPAWNNLIPLLNDPNENVRWHATNALWEIDSVAAQKLGIGAPTVPEALFMFLLEILLLQHRKPNRAQPFAIEK